MDRWGRIYRKLYAQIVVDACQQHVLRSQNFIPSEFPGLPAGVRFDPSDVELLEHLCSKHGVGKSEPHMFIDEFIQTLESDEGICYTHPRNLPGVTDDGRCTYFFHKNMSANASGTRLRRMVEDLSNETVRWRKTGKTKSVVKDGIVIGWRKIMVLSPKPAKCGWVMHQIHIGSAEDEKAGDYVVSKIFYKKNV